MRRPSSDHSVMSLLGSRVLARVADLDAAVSDRVMSTRLPVLDHAMRGLSTAANHSKLWVALAGLLLSTRREDARVGAVTGTGAAALASLVVNQGMKRLLPRGRPAPLELGAARALRKRPTSSSFPSGHAASAAAFATGVSGFVPAVGPALFTLAAAVAYSRVHTGVHHASDVVAGFAVGGAVGAVVTAVLRRGVLPMVVPRWAAARDSARR